MDMIDTLKQTLDSVTASNKRNEELVVKLTAQTDQLSHFLVRAWREAFYGNNDLEALLQPAIATK